MTEAETGVAAKQAAPEPTGVEAGSQATGVATGVARSTNVRDWRRDAVQLVSVRPSRTGSGVRATLHATVADSVWAATLRKVLEDALPSEAKIYLIGQDKNTGRCHTAQSAIDFAINDYLTNGGNGTCGRLIG